MRSTRILLGWLCCGAALLAFGESRAWAAPGEIQLEARLLWGTDTGKPRDPPLKEVDATTKQKLKGVFKWKDYFEVDRQEFRVGLASKKRVRMSAKCDVEVENLGEAGVEVKLYGEGKLVVKKRQTLKPGELLVLAGDDRNDTAWFVILALKR